MTIRSIGCTLAITAVLGCGDGTPAQSSTPTTTTTTTSAPSTASAVERLSSATGEGALAAATATAYLHGLVSGSCERAMEKMFANQPIDLFATVAIGNIRKRGATIAVDVVQPGQAKPAMTLLLRQEDARWLLVDLPDSDVF